MLSGRLDESGSPALVQTVLISASLKISNTGVWDTGTRTQLTEEEWQANCGGVELSLARIAMPGATELVISPVSRGAVTLGAPAPPPEPPPEADARAMSHADRLRGLRRGRMLRVCCAVVLAVCAVAVGARLLLATQGMGYPPGAGCAGLCTNSTACEDCKDPPSELQPGRCQYL